MRPIYEILFETIYSEDGALFGRSHTLLITAPTPRQAAKDALRWLEDRRRAFLTLDPNLFGPLGALKMHDWAPYVVDDQGRLGRAPGFPSTCAGFEWKADFPVTIEAAIEVLPDRGSVDEDVPLCTWCGVEVPSGDLYCSDLCQRNEQWAVDSEVYGEAPLSPSTVSPCCSPTSSPTTPTWPTPSATQSWR
jgi:hypothetical protein